MRREAPLMVALAALLALAGAASAQVPASPPPLEVRVDPLPGPLDPFGAGAVTRVVVEADCLAVFDPYTQRARAVHLSVTLPPWATAHLQDELRMPTPCVPGTRVRDESLLQVRLNALAPAREPADVVVAARMDGPSGPLEATHATPLEASFVPGMRARVEQPASSVRPGEALEARVVVTSHANGPTVVSLAVWQLLPGWSATLPDEVELGPRGSTVSLPVRVVAPGDLRLFGHHGGVDVLVRAVDAADERGAFAESVEGVAVRAVSPLESPAALAAPLALLAAAAVGGVALARRAWRR